jgi:hypothetical protein
MVVTNGIDHCIGRRLVSTMNAIRYEICLHHLKADHEAGWNRCPVRLDVYADGEPQDSLTKYNGGSDVWDLSDSCYRYSRQIQFELVQDDGSDEGYRLALFTIYAGETVSYGETMHDDLSGYALDYAVSVAHGVVLVRE